MGPRPKFKCKTSRPCRVLQNIVLKILKDYPEFCILERVLIEEMEDEDEDWKSDKNILSTLLKLVKTGRAEAVGKSACPQCGHCNQFYKITNPGSYTSCITRPR